MMKVVFVLRSGFARDFLLGAGAAALAYLMRRPLKKAAVVVAGELMNLGERGREALHSLREEIEDIVAEAGYEHVKGHEAANMEGNRTDIPH